MKILLGFYYGIGDFISAVPVIRKLSLTYEVHIAIGNQNKGLIELINLNSVKIHFFPLFSLSKIKEVIEFINILKDEKFDKVLVSPHAQDAVTSWKIPVMLKYMKSKNTIIVGSYGDKNSLFYDIRLPIDKSIPLMQREIEFIKLAGLLDGDTKVDINNIFKLSKKMSINKVVIHPGASKPIKAWKLHYYKELINMILTKTNNEVLFIGLEKELKDIKQMIETNKRIKYFSGSFKEVIEKTLNCKAIITMDSGFGHIASALGLNHFVLIGCANPQHIKPIFDNTTIVNIQKLSCQPCNGHYCKVGHNYCMDVITPKLVFSKIYGEIQ